MVSRIYTPYQPPISRPRQNPSQGSEAGSDTFQATTGGERDLDRPSKGLATLSEQTQTQKIHLDSILKDFKSTMGALGATDQVRQEVETYLNVIDMQARKEAPSVPMIKQTLKTAADSLDGYISNTLGQPSRVVRDWVEALLIQNVQFRYGESDPDAPPNGSLAGGAAPLNDNPNSDTPPSPRPRLSEEEKRQLKGFIEESHRLQGQKNWEPAQTPLEDSLTLLEGKDRPDLAGKIHHMLGRLHEKRLQPDPALSHYEQAAQQFSEAGHPAKQAASLYAAATLYDKQGQLEKAHTAYEQTLALDEALGDTQGMSRVLNDLGSLQLRQGHPHASIETLKRAFREASRPEGDPTLISDIFSNLGGAYRANKQYRQAYNAYRASLDRAIRVKDSEGAAATLHNLAALSLDAKKPERAMGFLRQAETLSPKRPTTSQTFDTRR